MHTPLFGGCGLSYLLQGTCTNWDIVIVADLLKMFPSIVSMEKELLLSALLQQDRLWILTHSEYKPTAMECQKYSQACKQLIVGQPLAYIIGYKRFYDVDFEVSRAVLIPRPETEELVDHVVAALQKNPNIELVADLGTGSGCIGATLARLYPKCGYCLVDKSKRALKVAQRNITAQTLRNVQLFAGDLLSPLKSSLPQLIVANLPYIGDMVWADMTKSITDFEPKMALYAGHDGLDAYKKLLKQIVKLYPRGEYPEMWWEISPEQEALIAGLSVVDYQIRFYQDITQRTRFVHLTNTGM